MPLRLVLIEDHQALREGLELLLGREGCDVVGTAGTAAEGRGSSRSWRRTSSLVDIRLGDDDGIDLTRRLLSDDPERRIVLYTGSSDEELLFDGLDSGARGYALKDGWPRELVEALGHVAGGGSYVDPRLRPALLSRRSTERLPSLSNREREILDLLAQGLTGEQVAERLVLSAETVKTHIRNAMNKLEANTRVHAIAIALREGYISPPDDAGVADGVLTPDGAQPAAPRPAHPAHRGDRVRGDPGRRPRPSRTPSGATTPSACSSAAIEMRELIDGAQLGLTRLKPRVSTPTTRSIRSRS